MPSYRSIFLVTIVLASVMAYAHCLRCYSCSTLAGARQCTYADFDKDNCPKSDCPAGSNICVTLTVVKGDNTGHLMRSCGIASADIDPGTCDGGLFSPSNNIDNSGNCLVYNCRAGTFGNSSVEVCAYSGDLSNNKRATSN